MSGSLSEALANRHVAGDARYVADDIAARTDLLEVWPVPAPEGPGLLTMRNPWPARRLDGVREVLMAEDVPGENKWLGGALFAEKEVDFEGQLVAAVIAESRDVARRGADLVEVDVQSNPGLLTIDEAAAVESFFEGDACVTSGSVVDGLRQAPRRVSGKLELCGEGDRNVEPAVAWAEFRDGGRVHLGVSTVAPEAVREAVGRVLGLSRGKIGVSCSRVGGMAEGGSAVLWAILAALAARKTGRAVRVSPGRSLDLRLGAKRHGLLASYEVGHDTNGRLRAVSLDLIVNGGSAVTDRDRQLMELLLQMDHAYQVVDVDFRARFCKTSLSPARGFRGRGSAMGAAIAEEIIYQVAQRCGKSPEVVRELNFYRGQGAGSTTPYGQEIPGVELGRMWNRLMDQSQFAQRRALVSQWNRENGDVKRGLAMIPAKVGMGSLREEQNQAAAFVQLSEGGEATVFLGDIDAGQGLHEKVRLVVASALGIDAGAVEMGPTGTDYVGAMPADGGAGLAVDLNGRAVRAACEKLVDRLGPVAKRCLDEKGAAPTGSVEDIVYDGGRVYYVGRDWGRVTFAEVVRRAHDEQVYLSATGHARARGVFFDWETGKGRPFEEFVTGVAAAEVELDLYTGEVRVLRVDVMQEAGAPLHAAIDLGLMEGGFTQGMAWLLKGGEGAPTMTIREVPMDMRSQFWMEGRREDGIGKGEAAVEAPFVLALSLREAIRDALGAVEGIGDGEQGVSVPLPATAEAIFEMLPEEEESVDGESARSEVGAPERVVVSEG
ncbi:MAG: molybdopterin cofactor-binding domain-containing protein [Verrucomicrobiota bacterium]